MPVSWVTTECNDFWRTKAHKRTSVAGGVIAAVWTQSSEHHHRSFQDSLLSTIRYSRCPCPIVSLWARDNIIRPLRGVRGPSPTQQWTSYCGEFKSEEPLLVINWLSTVAVLVSDSGIGDWSEVRIIRYINKYRHLERSLLLRKSVLKIAARNVTAAATGQESRFWRWSSAKLSRRRYVKEGEGIAIVSSSLLYNSDKSRAFNWCYEWQLFYTSNIEEYLMSQTFKGNIVAHKKRVLLELIV